MSSPQRKIGSTRLASPIASTVGFGVTQAAGQTTPPFKVGVTTRAFLPVEPYEWRGGAKHALATMIWYPADPGAEEKPQLLGPSDNPLFDAGRAAADAALAPMPAEFPLILLSHGTGGIAGNLAWLGTALARAGYVAAAVNHPGNNWIDGYTVAGFTLWWERACDLSAVIDGMLADPTFMTRIDAARIGGAGFSLGGYTMIAIAGGITSLAHFREFCASPDAENAWQAPPEFPDLRAKAEALADSDEAFRAALANDSRSYRDQRVRAVLAMAPGCGPASAFLPESLERIGIPVAIAPAPRTRAARDSTPRASPMPS
jgi:predicted dienelactone hydrolase